MPLTSSFRFVAGGAHCLAGRERSVLEACRQVEEDARGDGKDFVVGERCARMMRKPMVPFDSGTKVL